MSGDNAAFVVVWTQTNLCAKNINLAMQLNPFISPVLTHIDWNLHVIILGYRDLNNLNLKYLATHVATFVENLKSCNKMV